MCVLTARAAPSGVALSQLFIDGDMAPMGPHVVLGHPVRVPVIGACQGQWLDRPQDRSC